MKRMKRMWLEVVVSFITLALLLGFGASTALAGQFTSPKDKAKVVAIDKRLAAEKSAIAKKYNQEALKRKEAAVRAAVTKPVTDGDRGLPSPIKTAILTPFVTVGTGLMALGEGFNYVTKSKFETPVSQACRAVNTAKSQLLYHPINVAKEFFTGFTGKTEYYDPSKFNWLGERAQKRGPIAQMAEFAGTVIPPIAASTGIVAPVLGMTVPEMAIATGVVSAVGSVGVGEAFDAGEKKLVK